jgi:hypothetical protein
MAKKQMIIDYEEFLTLKEYENIVLEILNPLGKSFLVSGGSYECVEFINILQTSFDRLKSKDNVTSIEIKPR